ncbi:MAG: SDR family oxidoreductase [Acidobacteriota bacterium]
MANAVLITGASSGFGLLTARLCHARGWNVVPTARDVRRIPPAPSDPGRWLPLRLDVTAPDSVAAAMASALERFGALDAVVNNAGIGHFSSAEEAAPDALRREFEVNFFGAVAVARAALPSMRARRKGRLVFVSSQWGRTGVPGFSGYCAAKFALEGWAEALAHEVRPFGVAVRLVEPGAFDTGFGERSLSVGKAVGDAESPYAGLYARLRAGFASERNPTGEPVAEAIFRAVSGEGESRLRIVVGKEAEAWSRARFAPGEEAFLLRLAREIGWDAEGGREVKP